VIHLLPFHLAYSGKADVAAYFDDSQGCSYFRGRMMVGTPIDVPAGYTGQIWRSNGPSMAAPSTQAQSQSRKREREDNAESPRRSPRKHAAQPQKPVPKKQKKKPVKRQVFAMSPDASPVKQEGAVSNSGDHNEGEVLDQDMLDEKLKQAAVSPVKEEEQHVTDNAQNDAVKEEDIITVQEQAKDAPADEAKRVERAATPPPSDPTIHTLPTTPIQASSLPPSSVPQTPIQQQPEILQDSGPLVEKKLMPIAIFDKFTIWNPDNALDRGSDEYVRSLNEWIGLAELVSLT
jgi:hypothetical protein